MRQPTMSRRDLLVQGGVALTGLALLNNIKFAQAAPLQPGEEVIPWLDQMPENPVPEVIAQQLNWEELDSWITSNEQFFAITHYDRPEIDASDWRLEITGLVQNPMTLTLDDIKGWPRQEISYTIECAGNTGLPFFNGGIGNAVWAGTPLAPILDEAGILDDGIEIVFYGSDSGEETRNDITITQNFARSMSVEQAMHPYNLLCYEMNGEALPPINGYPLRLIAPGWYGIANVKWLKRIEVIDTRLMNRFMARDYVTLRKDDRDGEEVWTETSVTHARLKSAPARVVSTGDGYRIEGAAWGAPIAQVEVQIDDGEWQAAQIDTDQAARFSWKFWSLDWPDATPGEHTVTTRATDAAGNVQPTMDDPMLATKVTFWESNGQITRRVEIPS
jgi:DMSO/TMAO reductase YedYZ molybdopterin-dependent catalytic subunit